jgi:2-polyprenyl-6-methoxyphenol hydroxylase-like FAD-dependent oxidoreductase
VTNQYLQAFLRFSGTKDASSTRGRPEIDRIQLRQLLLDSLPADLIRWNHRVKSIEEHDGKYYIYFRDRPPETDFDLIIGGDGCWSKARKLLTEEVPLYSGVSGISFQISSPRERCPELYELVDRGSLFAFGKHRGVMAQQLGSGSLNVSYWSSGWGEEYINQFANDGDSEDIEAMKRACLAELDGWDLRLKNFIKLADSSPLPRNLYMLRIGITWPHRSGVTLLGDAAHVMTPFAGEGVNLAMSDAMKLAHAISTAAKSGTQEALSEGVQAYEEDMFKRAKIVQQQTYDMMSVTFFEKEGIDGNIEKYIVTAAGDGLPRIIRPLFWLALRCFYAVWRWRHPLPKQGENKKEGLTVDERTALRR